MAFAAGAATASPAVIAAAARIDFRMPFFPIFQDKIDGPSLLGLTRAGNARSKQLGELLEVYDHKRPLAISTQDQNICARQPPID